MTLFYRRFTAEGLNIERFVRRAGDAGIHLWSIHRTKRKLRGCVEETKLSELQQIAEKGGWRLIPGERVGAGRNVDVLRKRLAFCICALIVLVFVTLAMQFTWRVELTNAGVYEGDMRSWLDETGVKPFCWKHKISTAALRDALEWRYPDIAWAEVGWRGTTLQIAIANGETVGDAVDYHGGGDVVASRSGIIHSVVAVAGTPEVQSGDIVRKGQVLIRGKEQTSQGGTRAVAARGTIMARVWDGASVQMSIFEQETEYTGNTAERLVLSTPWGSLWEAEQPDFRQADVSVRAMPLGGLFFPVIVRTETYREAEITLKPRDTNQLKSEAALAAMRKLREIIGFDNDFIDKWVDYSMIKSEKLCAVAVGERIIDIGLPLRD